jgi:hypothetical protein
MPYGLRSNAVDHALEQADEQGTMKEVIIFKVRKTHDNHHRLIL